MPIIGPGNQPYRKKKKKKPLGIGATAPSGASTKPPPKPQAPPRFPNPIAAPKIPVAPPPMRSTPQEATYGINLKNLSQAYFQKYQTFPNAIQTYFMLNNANGVLWSADEWGKLLAPGKAAPSPLFLEFTKIGAGKKDPLSKNKTPKWSQKDLKSLGPKGTPKTADWVRQLANRPMHTLGKTWGGQGAGRINNDDIRLINAARKWYGGTELKLRINEDIAAREAEAEEREDPANEPDTVVGHDSTKPQFGRDPRMGADRGFDEGTRNLSQRAAAETGDIEMGLPGEEPRDKTAGGGENRMGYLPASIETDIENKGLRPFAINEEDSPWLHHATLPDFLAVPQQLRDLRARINIDIEKLDIDERDAYMLKAHDMVEWKRYWAGVMEAQGEKVPFDPDDLSWTPAAQKQYQRSLWLRLLPYAVQSKDAKIRDQALTAMQSVYPALIGEAWTDPQGKTPLKPVDMLANLNEVLESIPDQEAQKAYIYSAYALGRDPDDSDTKVLIDYVDQFGQNALPADMIAEYREHLLTINKVMAYPFEKLTGVLRSVGEFTDFGFEALGSRKGTMGTIGDGLERLWNAGILETNPLTSQAAPWVIGKAHQGAIMATDIAIDYVALCARDIEADFSDEAKKKFEANRENYIDVSAGGLLPAWHEWTKRWEEGAGKDFFVNFGEHFAEERGWGENDWQRQATRDLMSVASIVITIKLAAKGDAMFVRPGASLIAKGAFKGARRINERVTGPGRQAGFIGEEGPKKNVWDADTTALPDEARTHFDNLRAEHEDIVHDLMTDDFTPKDAPGNAADVISPKDVRARIRSEGGIDLNNEGTAPFIDNTLRGSERTAEFRGLGRRGQGRGLDDWAQLIKSEFPGLPFDDAEGLLEYIRRDEGTTASGLSRADKKALLTRLDELESDAADIIAGKKPPDRTPPKDEYDWLGEDTLDAPDALFDRSEVIGEGKQAGLDIAIDDTARKTEPVARVPERGPDEMPGQTAMDGPMPLREGANSLGPIRDATVFDEWVGQSTATKTRAGAQAADAVNAYRTDPNAATFEAAREAAIKSVPKHADELKALKNPHKPPKTEIPPAKGGEPVIEVVSVQRPSKKPLWELTRDEAEAAYRAEKAAEKGDIEKILGSTRAAEFRRLDRAQRKSNAGKDAYAEFDAFEKTLTKEEYNAIYGIGEDIYGLDDLQVVLEGYRGIDAATPETLGQSIAKAVTDIGEAIDPAKMNAKQLSAYVRIRYAAELAQKNGFDMAQVETAALRASARRFGNAEDASFMLSRYVPEEPVGQAVPAPRQGLPSPAKTAPDGVKVREVETPEGQVTVDASIAPDVQRLNDAGYKTHQSHGVKADHPAGHPARKAGPYVEFAVKDLDAGKTSDIRRAADEVGGEVVEGKATIDGGEQPTIIVRTPDVDGFTDALLGEEPPVIPPEGTPPASPPKTPEFSNGIPPTHPDYYHVKLLMTVSEWIAAVAGVRDGATIAKMLNIPDPAVLPTKTASVVKAAIYKMERTKDPEVVAGLIDEMVKAGVDTIDPLGPSFFRASRVNAYENALAAADKLGPLGRPLASAMSTFLTPIHLNNEVPFRDADTHVRNLGMSFRMGRRRMTRADMDDLKEFQQRMWETDNPIARGRVLDDFQAAVKRNMKEEGTWDSYKKFEDDILSARAKWTKTTFPDVKMEAYGKDSSVSHPLKTLYAEMADYRKKAEQAEAAGKPDVAKVWKAQADGLEARIKQQRDAGRIYTDAKKNPEKYRKKDENGRYVVDRDGEYAMDQTYKDAVATLRALGSEQPVWLYQMKQKLTIDQFNPRFLAWHQTGRTARSFMKYDTIVADPIVRLWKQWALAGLGFPIRVYAGDEFWRLPMEGIGPLEYKAARAAVAKMRGDLTRAERKLLSELNKKKELTDAEASELARIEEKATPKVPDDVLDLIKNDPDFVDADFGGLYRDYWQILAPMEEVLADGTVKVRLPDDPRYIPAVRRGINRFSEEPVIQRLLKRDDWTKEEALQDIRNLLVEDSEAGAALRAYLVETNRITLPMSDIKNGHLQRVLLRPSSGANRHLTNVMEDWVDLYINMQRSPEMLEGLRKGHIDLPTLQRIGETNPAALPPVPVGHFDTLVQNPWLHYANVGSRVYDRITLPLLQQLGNRVKDALFGHEYLKQRDAILAKHPDMDPQIVMEQAAGRAAHYVERTTYTRNATVFEDMARNHLLFINSYRQFWQYWMKKMVTDPLTMGAIWEMAPERDDPGLMGFFARNFSSYMPFFLQSKGFEGTREKTAGAMAGSIMQLPGPGPVDSPWLGALIRQTFDTDPSKLPFGSSMGEGMQPLQKFGTLTKGFLNLNLPWATDNTNSHALYKAWEKETVDVDQYNTPGTGVGRQQLQSNLPIEYKVMTWFRDKVAELGPEASEQWIRDHVLGDPVASLEMVRSLTGLPSFALVRKPPIYTKYREEAAKYFDLMKNGQPLRAATFLENTERYQYVKQYNETADPEDKANLLEEHPWIGPLARSNFTYDDEGVLIFDDEATRALNPKAMWNYRELLRNQYGGFETNPDTGKVLDNTENFYVGDLLRADQWPKVEKHVNDIKKIAEAAARELSTTNGKFNKKRFDMHMYQFDKRTSTYIKLGKWVEKPDSPDWYDKYLERHAKELGKDLPEGWDLKSYWHPKVYMERATGFYKSDYQGGSFKPTEDEMQLAIRLTENGLVPDPIAEVWFNNDTTTGQVARKVDKEALNSFRGQIINFVRDEFYDFDQKSLNRHGYDFGPEVNTAIRKIQDAYYARMGNPEWVDAMGGTSTREYRDERNRFHAYKDSVFGRIKGGEAFIGGTAERILHTPFLVGTDSMDFPGPGARKNAQRWQVYLKEARKDNPNIAVVKGLRDALTEEMHGRLGGQQAAIDWVSVAAVAKSLRRVMKTSYSEYYEGQGNSAYSNAGKAMVAKLEQYILSLAKKKKERTTFGRDLQRYKWDAHTLAFDMLEWYWQ